MKTNKTAAVIIVGNEILSGRTRERNAYYLAKELKRIGVTLGRIAVIPDVLEVVSAEVAALRDAFDYVVVCGGIGPTPDDVTRPAVAHAFNVACVPHPEATTILREFYGERCTERRLSMAELPEHAVLIPNPLTGAPGFSLENVFVLPGIPELVEAMFPHVASKMQHGRYVETEFAVDVPESDFADVMEEAMTLFPGVDIGSYPCMSQCKKRWACTIVVKGTDAEKVREAEVWLRAAVAKAGAAGRE